MISDVCLLKIDQNGMSSAIMESYSSLTSEPLEVVALDELRLMADLTYPKCHLLSFWFVAERSNEVLPALKVLQRLTSDINEFVQLTLDVIACDRVSIDDGTENQDWKPGDE